MDYVKITPSKLYGEVKIPPSKSISHRAVIASGLCGGRSIIDNVIFSDDIWATCHGMRCFGTKVEYDENKLIIDGSNFNINVDSNIDCCESGSTLRFLMPIALLTGRRITFTGRGRLKDRPLNPYYKIFDKQNIYYSSKDGLPLTIQGMLSPGDYEVEGNISSQFITGLMFALPLLGGDSRIIMTTELESKGYVDLTIETLKRFSIEVENHDYREFFIKGNQRYVPVTCSIEGDFSQAAFFLTAGVLSGEITCSGLNINSLQGDKVILNIIKKMGGDISVYEDKVTAKMSKLRGIKVDVSEFPDLVPAIAVLGALSEGKTEIINAGRLRMKESDRLKALAVELNKMGADVKEMEDGLMIMGKERLNGGIVDSWNDHRIAMALSAASVRCTEPVIITNSSAVRKSYPEFFRDFQSIGGIVNEWNMGERN